MYSHRNGETEPPTVAGRPSEFWFRGTGKYVMQDWQSDSISVAGKVFVSHVESGFLAYGQSITGHDFSFRVCDMVGQWWGPVTPPWDAPAAPPLTDEVREAMSSIMDEYLDDSCYYDAQDSERARQRVVIVRAWLDAQPPQEASS